jgi:hypothetical protein
MPAFISRLILWIAPVAVWLSLYSFATADDWPMWGRDWSHNMVSPEKGPPVDFAFDVREEGKLVKQAKNIVWSVPLGSRAFGTPVIADGRIWVATSLPYSAKNNEA